MGIIFFFMVTPIGFLMKILKKRLVKILNLIEINLIGLKIKAQKSKMKNQF